MTSSNNQQSTISNIRVLYQLLDYINQYCYIWDNKHCECPTKKNTLTFKNRSGKRFSLTGFKRYCDVFGFEIKQATNYFDYLVYFDSKEVKRIVEEWLEDKQQLEEPEPNIKYEIEGSELTISGSFFDTSNHRHIIYLPDQQK